MAKTYPFIRMNLSQEEKDKFIQMAKEKNMSASEFAYENLKHIFTDEEEFSLMQKADKAPQAKKISVGLTENEYNTIKEKAGSKPITKYIRESALNGSKVINITVEDDDVKDLLNRIQPLIHSFTGVVKALKVQKQLHEVQANRMEELISSIEKELKEISREIMKNRNSIKNTRLRELRKRTNKAIKSDN